MVVEKENVNPFLYRGKLYRLYETCPSEGSANYTAEALPNLGLKAIVVKLLHHRHPYAVFVTKGDISTEILIKETHRLAGKYPKRIVRKK